MTFGDLFVRPKDMLDDLIAFVETSDIVELGSKLFSGFAYLMACSADATEDDLPTFGFAPFDF